MVLNVLENGAQVPAFSTVFDYAKLVENYGPVHTLYAGNELI